MQLQINHRGTNEIISLDNQDIDLLSALRDAGIVVSAPCGGNGSCGKCRVLIKRPGEESYSEVLACTIAAEDGLEVVVAHKDMEVETEGTGRAIKADSDKSGYGVAIDVGTTTMACYIHDLSTGQRLASCGTPNPQASYGGDVISRIEASVEGKLDLLCQVLDEGLQNLIEKACRAAGIESSQLTEAVLVGNTVMEHFATHLSPNTIGVTPFTPLSFFGQVEEQAATKVPTYLAPAVSGYVGGDITAGVLISGLPEASQPRLFIDVGTNGEMAFGCREKLMCCATAAGPAFEGAGIEFGMPAGPGAISRVVLVGEKAQADLSVELMGDDQTTAIGLCGSGLIDAIAALIRAGIIDETGYLMGRDDYLDEMGSDASPALVQRLADYQGDNAVQLMGDVVLTSKDVRAVQLAKAAICAGVYTMIEAYGCSVDEVEELILAGGFGSHIDLASAATIGLYPPELLPVAHAIGNAAGEGAAALLVSNKERKTIAELAEKMEYIELSVSAAFNGYYVDCMGFGEE